MSHCCKKHYLGSNIIAHKKNRVGFLEVVLGAIARVGNKNDKIAQFYHSNNAKVAFPNQISRFGGIFEVPP